MVFYLILVAFVTSSDGLQPSSFLFARPINLPSKFITQFKTLDALCITLKVCHSGIFFGAETQPMGDIFISAEKPHRLFGS